MDSRKRKPLILLLHSYTYFSQGMLTPAQKLQRKKIQEKYKEEIKRAYGEGN